jgi:hypothetical protein
LEPTKTEFPQGLKPNVIDAWGGTTEEAAEKSFSLLKKNLRG